MGMNEKCLFIFNKKISFVYKKWSLMQQFFYITADVLMIFFLNLRASLSLVLFMAPENMTFLAVRNKMLSVWKSFHDLFCNTFMK